MTSRRLVKKTLEFDRPERIPRHLWFLPWAEAHYPEQLRRIQIKFPDDIVTAPRIGKTVIADPPQRYQKGLYKDEWGCVFENAGEGTIGIVRHPLIASWQDFGKLKIPDEFLDLNKDEINRFCRATEKFVLAGTWVRPFERLQFLRTTENLLLDLLEQPPQLFELIGKIHDFYLKELEAWSKTDVDGLAVMDDWGSQNGLLASPETFSQIFKPLYKDYAAIARHYHKFLFMHSDGHILEVMPDLVEVGIDAINSQIFCMGPEKLERFRGKITFWGEIDRQHTLAYGNREDVIQAVNDAYEHLYSNGGVIAQCEFGPGANPENVELVFETWAGLEFKNERKK